MATIAAIGTSVPTTTLTREHLLELADGVLPDEAASKEQMLGVIEASGIEQRHLARDIGWYLEPHGHEERSQAFIEAGLPLAQEALTEALDRAGAGPGALDGIVLVNTTGLSAPSLEGRLADRMGLDPALTRLPIWGLGCAGGVAGLNRAAEVVTARPDDLVALISIELCSLVFELDRMLEGSNGAEHIDKKTLISAMLFGDGCACALVAGDDHRLAASGPRVVAGRSHLFEGTQRVMGWDVQDTTLDVVLSPRIPDITAEELSPVVHGFLDDALAKGHEVDHWVMHPGGRKVLEGYRKALGLDESDLTSSRQVLNGYGNMSSPTVLFVLDQVLEHAMEPGETALAAALGPGFAAELALLEG